MHSPAFYIIKNESPFSLNQTERAFYLHTKYTLSKLQGCSSYGKHW